MKFSLFYEMQIADPTRESEARMFRDCLEQAELAEALGYHCIWEVEHHGLYEYSHSSAPEIFLAFVAARTKRIRIGHGVTLLPHRYNHPIRIAERIATLDILSEGRVNWGSGKSSSLVEQDAFENDKSTLHEQWLEAVKIIPQMWASDVFEYKGKFFQIPPTQIVPKPVQQPHPPMFAACTKPDSAAFVGKLGLGALNFAISDDYSCKKSKSTVRRLRTPSAGRSVTNHSPARAHARARRRPRACRYGFRGARFFTVLARYYLSDWPPGRAAGAARFHGRRRAVCGVSCAHSGRLANVMCGDPACAQYRALHRNRHDD
jgi:alkanesulfonate monooxygenase SsuD/methylene tetrahydromethanopterin reductase-like flavin-dependent oxidoreductase (luciferase family)